MSKIICEICGTVYPDNATLCPICGCPRNMGEENEIAEEQAVEAGARATQRVRGGRFSNKNVKKRNQQSQSDRYPASRRGEAPKKPEKESGDNRGLVITVLILLAAVILLGAYIGFRFFRGAGAYDETTQPTAGVVETQETTAASSENIIACTDLDIGGIDLEYGVEFLGAGRAWRMAVTTVPEDTTEEIQFSSSDENIAKVSVTNNRIEIISVGPGSATITVTCGAVTKEFPVNCNFDDSTEPTGESTDSSETTDETTEETTEAEGFGLNRSDITFSKKDETFTFNPGKGISIAQCTWSSDDETVAIVENGKVTAVGPGTAEITAEFNGEKDTCIIRCNFPEDETDTTEETETTDETDESETTEATDETTGDEDENWEISHRDVSIKVGESFTLTLRNADGETADVTWTASDGDVSVSGGTVTGVESGTSEVTCTYNGETYKCIVRVS